MVPGAESFEGFRWRFAPDAPEAVCQRLDAGRWGPEATVLKRNRRRVIYRLPGAPGLILKHDRPPRLVDRVKGLWRHAGLREYEATVLARDRGLPVAAPVGFARRGGETLYAAVELAGCEKLRDAWERARHDPGWRERLLAGLAVFAGQFAAGCVKHPDMHTGNVLVRDDGSRAACFLVDLAGARALTPGARSSPWDTAGWLAHLAPTITQGEALRLLAAAGVAEAGDAGLALWLGLLRQKGREAARRWPGRRARLLADSSLCETAQTADGQWRLYRPFPLALAQQALGQHDAKVGAGTTLKDDRKRRLSRVSVDGQALVVKEFLLPGQGPWRPDRRSWLNHYRLSADAFPVCRCHAWLQGCGRGVLVLEDVGRVTLQQACLAVSPPERRRLLAATMRLLAYLHATGVVPRDMKATNVVVCPGMAAARPVCLVDADAVRFDVRVGPAHRTTGLRQLIGNLPAGTGLREVLRALVGYRRASGISRQGLRLLLGDGGRWGR